VRFGPLPLLHPVWCQVSYPRGLDEVGEHELLAELKKRADARAANVCDYCGRNPKLASCKFRDRHTGRRESLALMVAHLREFMAGFDWDQPEHENVEAAVEATWCNIRDDKPSEYFSCSILGTISLEDCTALLDEAAKIVKDEDAAKEPH